MNSYLYGIVAASHPKKLKGLRGIGPKPASLRAVEAGELAVVVSDAPADIRPKRRDLLAHEVALEALCEQGPTLPMRFGVLADDDESVAREVSAEQDRYRKLLSDLHGRIEMNVKATHEQEAVLRAVLTENDDLMRSNEQLRERGGDYETRARFGEMVAAAVADREQHDAANIVARLAPHALAQSGGPAVDGCFVNHSFLVDRESAEEFEAVVRKVGEMGRGYLRVQVRGPLPPYSFAGTATGD
jgi:hypothetical protein